MEKLSSWITNNILVALIFLVVVFSLQADELVRLRAIEGPVGTWENTSNGLSLTKATVRVKNTSAATAHNIQVILKVYRGKEVPLRGPFVLEKYQEADFSINSKIPVTAGTRLSVRFKCDNCRK
jgi:hypothetical protein